jgi:hypothetical protein
MSEVNAAWAAFKAGEVGLRLFNAGVDEGHAWLAFCAGYSAGLTGTVPGAEAAAAPAAAAPAPAPEAAPAPADAGEPTA